VTISDKALTKKKEKGNRSTDMGTTETNAVKGVINRHPADGESKEKRTLFTNDKAIGKTLKGRSLGTWGGQPGEAVWTGVILADPPEKLSEATPASVRKRMFRL